MPFETWDEAGDALLRALGLLADGEFLILGEPISYPAPRRGLFGRRARPEATRYVQVLRIEDLYTAECVGATSLGGTWEMSRGTIERLRRSAGARPTRASASSTTSPPTSTCTSRLTAAPTLAELLVTSLQHLGARPEGLTLQTPT